jgi:phytanoyl-CoA hydroxylase
VFNLHPFNRGFTWQDHEGPCRFLEPDQRRRFDAEGYVVIDDVFDADTVADVLAAIDPREETQEQALREHGGRVAIARADEITFTTHLAGSVPRLRDLVCSPPLRDLCLDLVGPDVRLYWDQAVYKKPGTTAPFPWHQDNGYTFIEPQQYLTCWIALTDATVDNGCPWVVPGLHRLGTLEHRTSRLGYVCLDEADDAVAAPVGAGGMVVFSSLTPHCTGANTTDSTRKAYIVQYAQDGSKMVTGDAPVGDRVVTCDDPVTQFPVLVGGSAPSGS